MCNLDSRHLIHIPQTPLEQWVNQLKERREGKIMQKNGDTVSKNWDFFALGRNKTHKDCKHAVDFLCILEGRYTGLNGGGSHSGHWLHTWSLNRHQRRCLGDRPHCRHNRCLSSIPIWLPLKHAKVKFIDMLMLKKLLWNKGSAWPQVSHQCKFHWYTSFTVSIRTSNQSVWAQARNGSTW